MIYAELDFVGIGSLEILSEQLCVRHINCHDGVKAAVPRANRTEIIKFRSNRIIASDLCALTVRLKRIFERKSGAESVPVGVCMSQNQKIILFFQKFNRRIKPDNH